MLVAEEWNGMPFTDLLLLNRLPDHYYDEFVLERRLKEYDRAYRCCRHRAEKAKLPGW
jgi:hypothetical protein